MNYKTFNISHGNENFRITLNYPEVSLTSYNLNWITVMEDQQRQMDPATSESESGDGNRSYPKAQPNKRGGQGFPGVFPHFPQQMSSHPQPGPQGFPQNTWKGQEQYRHPMPSMEQMSSPPPSQNMSFHQSGHQPVNNPHGSNPNVAKAGFEFGMHGSNPNASHASVGFDRRASNPSMSTAGSESGRPPNLDLQNQEWSMVSQSSFGQGYPVSHSGGSVTPSMPQHQNFNAPGCTDSRPMQVMSPFQAEEGSEPFHHKMEDLNLRQDEPFPYYPSRDQPSMGPCGPNRDTPMAISNETFFQSDFEVLSDVPEGVRSIQHPHFHLLVTELPPSITESELRQFFEDSRQSGGGPVTKVELNASARSAAVFFSDEQVIQHVLHKSPLLLNDKMIKVERSSAAKPQPAEPEVKTVEIRGLESEDDIEMCSYYFENPSKGGGDIESHEWNQQEQILYITFSDPEVAKMVSTKGHKLGKKVLEVSLYSPPVEEAEESPPPQCTVEVRGFDPEKTELYEIYFSNPKKGGDNVVDLSLSEDKTVMFITFETPEVAQRVAEKPHKISGRQLDVIVAPVEDPTPPCTVLVLGCDLEKEDTYRYYFENPNKGGGDIVDLVLDRDQQAILITFQDPEVAQAVIARQHKVGGRNLEVSLYKPKKVSAKRQKSQEPSGEEEEAAPSRTVVVSMAPNPLQSEDTYILYFESPRHGGGEVENMQFDEEKQLVYITFTDPAVAERVAGKTHTIVGYSAQVTLYVPPKPKPTYPNKLLFQNVAGSTTRDCLSMYLERITGMEPQDILYGDEVGTVLVTFPHEPDFPHTHQMTRQRQLERRQLTVSRVPISSCLLVENLADKTTEDTVQLYFENKRSRGGPVEKVDMIPTDNKCLVYFESHEVLDGVLSREHKLDGQPLKVKRYMECLGQSGGSDDPTAFTMPHPLTLDQLDRFKVAFLRQSQTTKSAFLEQLSSSYAEGKFQGDKLIINCTLTPEVPKARIQASTWSVDVQQTVTQFLTLLEVKSYKVMQQLWTEVDQAVREASLRCPDRVTLFPSPEDSTYVVVGMESMASQLYDQLAAIITTKEAEIERRKQQITETISSLETSQLNLLIAVGFHGEAGKRHEGLKVDIQKKKKCIEFHGMLKDVKEAQVEMYQVLQSTKSSQITNMTDRQIKVLGNQETKLYIINKLKNDNTSAVWEISDKGEIKVFAFGDKSLVRAIHLMNESLVEHVCQLSPESRELLLHQDWQHLLSEMMKRNPGVLLIAPSHGGLQVFVTSTDHILHHVVEEVEKFFAENTVYTQTVCFSPSRQKLVHMKWKNKLQDIGTNLRAYKVKINMPEPGDKVLIQGTRKGLEEVMKHLETLNRQILCHTEEFEDSSKVKLLSSDCSRDLKTIGRSCQCVLSLQPEDPQLQVTGSSSVAPAGNIQVGSGDIQTSASAQLPNGVTVAVVKGDITQMAVGAIVNAANSEMNHIGGLAQDIVKKGGDSIQKECHEKLRGKKPLKEGEVLVSGPGRLPCQLIVHAVGPMYKGGYSGEKDCLFDTVMMCLRAANDSSLSSIAIPAISTGIFGYPAKEATQIISEAVKVFFDSQRRCTVKNVFLCHIGADIVGLFEAALRKTFQRVQRAGGYEQPTVKKEKVSSVPYYTSPPRARSMAYGGYAGTSSQRIINVSVIPGEIAKQSADVIVNSTSGELDLQKGAVSSSILKAAGQSLQMECKSKYPGGLQTGGLAQTQGHGLNCREIFHIVLCNYSSGAQQVLSDVVTKCLAEASRKHYTSLAFPVLGTGNLRFPAPVVAQTMLNAIHQFEQTMPATTLRNVSIVVYPADRVNLQEFQSAQSGTGGTGSSGTRQDRTFSEKSGSRTAQSWRGGSGPGATANAEFGIGGLRFVIKQGDITDEDTDAIVNSTNDQLDLSRGGVASALKRKCGRELEEECYQKVRSIQDDGVVITKAYRLNSQIIVHVNADRFSMNWEDGIERCFKMAEQNGVRSIAMPALGTGIGLAPSLSAQALFNTVVKMYKYGTRPGSLEEVRVVLFDRNMVPKFTKAVQETGEKHNQSRKGFFSKVMSAFTGNQAVEVKQTVSNPVVETVTLFIYAESQPDVHEALKMLDDVAKEKFTRKEIQDEVVISFDEEDIRRVQQICRKHQTEVQIRTMTGQIIIDGLNNQVFDCMHEINALIRQEEHKRQQKEAAEMLANMVSWCYLEVTQTGTEQKEYQPKENHIIETAYKGKKKFAEIKDDIGSVYIIDFNSMKEYPQDNPTDSVTVMRKDKIKDLAGGQVPENWEPQGPNEAVKLVDLKATDQEYQNVAQAFNATVPNVTVTKISRVQNTHLYHQYMAKKAHMEKQNTGVQNEKILWHGTSSDAITNINHYGFNRSFCGKNATVHGDGVYFAINANYSASTTYSPPDTSGNRYVYQCKVLVGHATVGQRNLRVLPPRSGAILYDSATDNPQGPSMYVIFNDTQAYPEYMITFQ